MAFVWNEDKAWANLAKHAVAFEEAVTAFLDPLAGLHADPRHSEDEDRFLLLGVSERGHLLVVVHTERGDDVRIISARLATPTERKQYEEEFPL